MKQNPKFTERLQAWLNTPDKEKDYAEGALMLLQLSGNQIMYRNISVNPKGKAEFIIGRLQQYLKFRLAQLTHEQVVEMQQQVEEIVKTTIRPQGEGDFADFKAGKRADHDALPDEIQVLYVENLDIVHRMRELHENWDTYDHFVVEQAQAAQDNAASKKKTTKKSQAK